MDAWGLKGGFKVQAYSSDPQALFSSKRWFLKPPEPDAKRPLPLKTPASSAPAVAFPGLLKVTSAREQGDLVVATAQEVPDRNAAEALRGARVFVSRLSFPTAEANEFYWIDLIGLDVSNREGLALGRVVGLLETGPHCVLRVLPAGSSVGEAAPADETLIPFVDAFVDRVDLEARCIVVDWGADY
jgi:16S rRNA processing protein RimM